MSKVKFHPVDNGDTSVLQVTENSYTTNIPVDCNIHNDSVGSNDSTMFDVKADLLRNVNTKTVNGISMVRYIDMFILTHGDIDHIRGFKKHFYQGDPNNYWQANKDASEIFIDTMWFSPMGGSNNDDEDVFNREARRRIQIHRDKSPNRDLSGNRIAIIGYDGNEKLEGLDLKRCHRTGNIILISFENRH